MAQVKLTGGPLDGQWVKPDATIWTAITQDGCTYRYQPDSGEYVYESGEPENVKPKKAKRTASRFVEESDS